MSCGRETSKPGQERAWEPLANAPTVTVIGGGLAGCEAAWQLLRAGLQVELLEARPAVQSPAHHTLLLGELVCSNSLRADAPGTPAGLLKQELRRAGSLVMRAADATRVPAGGALAVDRTAFAWRVTAELLAQPGLRLRRVPVRELPPGPVVLASGPLTSPELMRELSRHVPGGLYFYDAIAPIVDGASIDETRVFRGARRDQSQDYINCPLSREEYRHLEDALRAADQVPPHPFEERRYFEGCLPVEVMAARGDDVLAYGPLRPVGLLDPRTLRKPYAVVQLRAEDLEGTAYNMVGFQTRLSRPEQRRVFRMIPGLERAQFLRYGSIHRNAFLDAPRVLGPRLELRAVPRVRAGGQLAGAEGYIESTAVGLLAALMLAAELRGQSLAPPHPSTALGAIVNHLLRPRATSERFEPSNITFGLLPEPAPRIRDKMARRLAVQRRAEEALEPWLETLRFTQFPESSP